MNESVSREREARTAMTAVHEELQRRQEANSRAIVVMTVLVVIFAAAMAFFLYWLQGIPR